MVDEITKPVTPEVKPEPTVDEHIGLIAAANAAADRVEKANREMNEMLKKQELLLAEQRLQGRAYAGSGIGETADEKWAREAKLRYKGTGMDPTPNETKKV